MNQKILVFSIIICTTLYACSGGKDKKASGNETVDNTSVLDKIDNVSKAADAMNEATKQAEVLKKCSQLLTML